MRHAPARTGGPCAVDCASQQQHSAGQRRGLSTLEFALVAPVFFLFVLGIIEIGRGLMINNFLNNAARAGCREGILEGKSDSDIATVISGFLSKQGVSGHSVSVKVNDATANASTAKSNDEVTVRVSVPVSNITWLPGGQYLKGTLSGQYSLRRE